ncbi:TetR/AcrR family transcriptional regulator [Chryseotalea sanaruensis]|uniref:TetR/AcrR family transcriptional regulator n=1 Tax=Chryseotalea sanaruensis TaxID=2482724 RepID=A0A401UDR9_9BACT|nr:TetR/AcrR family transcriptional regulator [Chryseotalea sanaruensis]GCC53039.1 TetR/AcrR family transcriptional regulator [Chryseotalea sanaruensis]
MGEVLSSSSRKAQVIRVAAELFREKGYVASSMRDLAQKLGIEAASLYSHIKSKEEILHILCFDMAEDFMVSLNQVEKQQNLTASQRLQQGIIGHIQVMARDLTASAVFMNEHRHLSQPFLRDFLLLRINYINRFKKMIEDGVADGEFKKEIDKKLAVMTLFSSLNWMPQWYNPDSVIDPESLGKQLADMLVNGLKQNR